MRYSTMTAHSRDHGAAVDPDQVGALTGNA
jgi:hypothetical protein